MSSWSGVDERRRPLRLAGQLRRLSVVGDDAQAAIEEAIHEAAPDIDVGVGGRAADGSPVARGVSLHEAATGDRPRRTGGHAH